jgi:hypothetical protein
MSLAWWMGADGTGLRGPTVPYNKPHSRKLKCS